MAVMQAPVRRMRDGVRKLLRSPAARRRDRMFWGFPNDPGFPSGDREPRRAKPTLPADAVALDVPREQ